MSTSLTVPERAQNPLVTFEGVDASVFPITAENLNLVQGTTRGDNLIIGQFNNKETGGHIEELYAVPINLYTKRVLFPPTPPGAPLQLGQKPLCRSNDGIRSAEDVIDRKAIFCEEGPGHKACSFSQWTSAGGKKIKPPCARKLLFTFMDIGKDGEGFKAFRLNISGSNVSPLEKAFKSIRNEVAEANKKAQYKRLVAKQRGEEFVEDSLSLGFDSFVIKITVAKVSNERGVYYVMNFLPRLRDMEFPEISRQQYKDVVAGLELGYRNRPLTDDEGDEYEEAPKTEGFVQEIAQAGVAEEPTIEA